ncbi:MAG: hypothetical protein AB8B73_10890, partial [Ekhidna sp.]
MKKISCLLFVLPLFAVKSAYSQFGYHDLQGEWNVIKMENDKEVNVIHGPENAYLKFTFEKRKLFISKAPFDKGIKNEFYIKEGEIKKNHFEPLIAQKIWHQSYKIEKVTEDEMILDTKTMSGRKVRYFLEKIIAIHSEDEKIVFDPIFFVTFFNEQGVDEQEMKVYSFDRGSFHFKTPTINQEESFLEDLKRNVELPTIEDKSKIMGLDVVVEVILDGSGNLIKLKKKNADNTSFTDSIMKSMAELKWDVG